MHGKSTDYLEHPFEFFANIKAKIYEDVQLVIKPRQQKKVPFSGENLRQLITINLNPGMITHCNVKNATNMCPNTTKMWHINLPHWRGKFCKIHQNMMAGKYPFAAIGRPSKSGQYYGSMATVL